MNNVHKQCAVHYTPELFFEIIMEDEATKKTTPSTSPSPVGGESDMTVMTDLGLPVL